jgi:hypothetical protein
MPMRRLRLLALLVIVVLTAPSRAADIAPLFPDGATFAVGLDVKGITTSPLGKKVIGNDKPFDATRKLLHVLFPENVLPVAENAVRSLETVANRLERVSIVGALDDGGSIPIAIFLEGDIDEAEYVTAAENIAKAEKKAFMTEKLGERKLLILGEGAAAVYGLRVRKGVFAIVTRREMVDEILDKDAGKKKATMQKALAASLAKVKPAETPIWLAVGEIKGLGGVTGGVATIALKDDVGFRIEIGCDKEELAGTLKGALESIVAYLGNEKTPQAKVWKAAGIKVKQDGTSVTASGSIPGKLLAEEYAKQQ